jgi:hypothetical protein
MRANTMNHYYLLRKVQRAWTYSLCDDRGARLLRGASHSVRENALDAISDLRTRAATEALSQARITPKGSHFFSVGGVGRFALATSNYFESEPAMRQASALFRSVGGSAPLVEERVRSEPGVPVIPDADEERHREPLCYLEPLRNGFWLALRDERGDALLATLATPVRARALVRLTDLHQNAVGSGQYSLHTSETGQYTFRLRDRLNEVFATSPLCESSEARNEKLSRCLAIARARTFEIHVGDQMHSELPFET